MRLHEAATATLVLRHDPDRVVYRSMFELTHGVLAHAFATATPLPTDFVRVEPDSHGVYLDTLDMLGQAWDGGDWSMYEHVWDFIMRSSTFTFGMN